MDIRRQREHMEQHAVMRALSSTSMADMYKESTSSEMPALGSRVRRGPDWRWDNQDGEGPGTIIGHEGQ